LRIFYRAFDAARLRFFKICVPAAKLDADQFGSRSILDANQFESVLDSADGQNRIRQSGFRRAGNE
jgi:hypothetical protein